MSDERSVRRGIALVLRAIACWFALAGAASADDRGIAFQVVDFRTGRVASTAGEAVIARPSLPGSTMKLPALIAALESGTISATTRIACPGFADVAGRRVACLHPRVRRPITPAEALSYSCNAYFAAVGARLPRARLNGVLSALGLPAAPAGAPMALVAAGLVASPVAPSSLLRAFIQVLGEPAGVEMSPRTRAVIVEGLRGAAVFGTAAAFGARGVEALAKTGTADAPGGGTQGLVLAAWPAARPQRAAVVLVAGGAGPDAAERAAAIARDGVVSAANARVGPAAAPGGADPAALTLRVGFASSSGYDVRALRLEDYVARVLAGEAAPRSAPAALEALAVTVRTFALANRARHRRDGFDLCDLTHCQVLREPYAAVREAAGVTAGLVLAWEGAPASVYYTASCGGVGERPSNVWPGAPDPPFLPSRPDTGCGGQPSWSTEITAAELTRALVAAGFRGRDVRDVRVRSRSESGRVLSLGVPGMTPDEVSGQALRMAVGRTLGWQLIKSTDFQVTRASRGYRFTGRGFGHGVGFCVIGATRRAAAGASRASLLDQYFPGARVVPLSADLLGAPSAPPADPATPLASGDAVTTEAPTSRSIGPAPLPRAVEAPAASRREALAASAGLAPAGLSIVLPAADERDRPYVTAMVEHALAAAAARVGRARPSTVRVVFHPTVESFTRETGESWWSSASSSGSRIDLQPSSVLRERGELEATIAHEAGHVVTGPALAGRARWVQEGAAMFAAGAIPPQEIAAARRLGPPTGCPPDAALAKPPSAGAAREAYARARECFARALAANARWDEIR